MFKLIFINPGRKPRRSWRTSCRPPRSSRRSGTRRFKFRLVERCGSGDQRAEHSSGQKVSYRARDSTLVRCANMLCEKFFISGFIASTWGYDLPLPGVISPPLLAPDGCLKANSSALQTYLNFCVIEQCPSLLSFDLKENSLAETRLLLDEFLFRGACKKGDNSDKGISGVPAPHKGNLPSLSDFRWWSAGSRSRLKSRRSGARRRS